MVLLFLSLFGYFIGFLLFGLDLYLGFEGKLVVVIKAFVLPQVLEGTHYFLSN
jgi:hypothetical protein